MDSVVLLWSIAIFLGGVFAAVIIGITLEPKYKAPKRILAWSIAAVIGLVLTYINYSISLTNDVFGVFGLFVLMCIPLFIVYKGTISTKLFIACTGSLISNVSTFMFCGTTDSLVAPALGLIKESPYEVPNLLFFIGIKVVVYTVIFFLYKNCLRDKFVDMIGALSGKMGSFVLAPAISVLGFYVINTFTNVNGIFPNHAWFFPLYLTICIIFVVEFFLLFHSVLWTARAMKNEAELGVATHIQGSMLPSDFKEFSKRGEFDICATMVPAKEVGGDFYDFFRIDESRIAMVIADVSGKGVPAALFMVVSKTLLKNVTQSGLTPKEILEKVNNQLCENNEAEMFVTVWLGILDINTGMLTCVNAGHEYPAIRRANGEFELFKDKHGFVLAGMENARYREYEIQLQKGDTVFVYTDGVAEATDVHNQLFGTERMIEALNKNSGTRPEEILRDVKVSVDEFVGTAPQFDDLTMLAIQLNK
ncbi:MAG: SpoIIE family protein phosphatase [Eubacteriales bacterium]